MKITKEELVKAQLLYNIDCEVNPDIYKEIGTYNPLSEDVAKEQVEQLLKFVEIVRSNEKKE